MSGHLEGEVAGLASRIEQLEERVLKREPTQFNGQIIRIDRNTFDARSECATLKARMIQMQMIVRVMAEVIEKQAGQIEDLVEVLAENGIE